MPDVYIGKPWNTDMPTLGHGWRVCPCCKEEVYVERILAYEDGEQWTCPRGACGARVTQASVNGRYGSQVRPERIEKPDRTKELSDFKRNADKRYRSRQWREQNVVDD